MQGEHETQRSIGRRDARVVARQRWRDLLLLHWPAPLDALRARVPASLELDTHEGRAWVSVLAFRAEHTRPRGVPSQWGLDFDELNLRTYVRHQDTPGVFFLAIDASSPLAVAGARLGTGLPYHVAAQRSVRLDGEGSFHSHAGARHLDVRHFVGRHLGPAPSGTLDHFLVERYALFTRRGPALQEMRVTHDPYDLHEAELVCCEQTLTLALGVQGAPERAHWCDRLDVAIRGPWWHRA